MVGQYRAPRQTRPNTIMTTRIINQRIKPPGMRRALLTLRLCIEFSFLVREFRNNRDIIRENLRGANWKFGACLWQAIGECAKIRFVRVLHMG
jgi:hypothetical protein